MRAANEVVLGRLETDARALSGSALIATIVPALHALAVSTLANSEQYRRAVDTLSERFWRNADMAELAGLFLLFCHHKNDAFTEAAKVGEELVRRNPRNLFARTSLGSTYYFAHRLEDAAACYQAAVAMAPDSAQAHMGYAKVAWRLGRLDQAAVALQAARGLKEDARVAAGLDSIASAIAVSRRLAVRPIIRTPR